MIAAQERAAIILKVRSGQLTVTEAARQLGISRQRYYELEQVALQAMIQALEPKPPGRPPSPKPDPALIQLERQVTRLENELHTHQQRERLRVELKDIAESVMETGSKKNAR